MLLTKKILKAIAPTLSDKLADNYLPYINEAMSEFEINTQLRMAAFLAQILHETGEFRYMAEIWGPSDSQRRYEPPSKKAIGLGNTQPGDGYRFKGRGAIQLTGRANYAHYSKTLGVDLIDNPKLAETKELAFRIAGAFWQEHGLNELADRSEFETITRRINGGLNGYKNREDYYKSALKAFETI